MVRSFFAVTVDGALYRVGKDSKGFPTTQVIAKADITSPSVIMGSIIRGPENTFPDKIRISAAGLCGLSDQGGEGSCSAPIRALFCRASEQLAEQEARACLAASGPQPMDSKWLRSTEVVLIAIGHDDPVFLTELP